MVRRRWPEVRAGLLALAIAIGLVDGCPLDPTPYATPWKEQLAARVRPVRAAVLTPVAWISRGLRFQQRWALMQVGPRERYRFTVEGKPADGGWQVLYRAGDPDHAAFADQLENAHVTGAWNPTDRPTGQFVAFTGWLSRHVLAARPELAAVRLGYELIVLEDGALHATGRFVHPVIRHRGRR